MGAVGLDELRQLARVAVGVGLRWPAVAADAVGHAVGGVVPHAAVPAVRGLGCARVDVHGLVLSVAGVPCGRLRLGRRVPAVRPVGGDRRSSVGLQGMGRVGLRSMGRAGGGVGWWLVGVGSNSCRMLAALWCWGPVPVSGFSRWVMAVAVVVLAAPALGFRSGRAGGWGRGWSGALGFWRGRARGRRACGGPVAVSGRRCSSACFPGRDDEAADTRRSERDAHDGAPDGCRARRLPARACRPGLRRPLRGRWRERLRGGDGAHEDRALSGAATVGGERGGSPACAEDGDRPRASRQGAHCRVRRRRSGAGPRRRVRRGRRRCRGSRWRGDGRFGSRCRG